VIRWYKRITNICSKNTLFCLGNIPIFAKEQKKTTHTHKTHTQNTQKSKQKSKQKTKNNNQTKHETI
jgi:hypothetical protein